MPRRILLIDHPVGQRDDRASRWFEERGCSIEWVCPGKGDPLPARPAGYDAVVVYGGTENLSEDQDRPYLREELAWIGDWVGAGRPYLGICLGGQLLARALGAEVGPHPEGQHQIGFVEIEPTPVAGDFLDGAIHVYHWHKEGFDVPEGAALLASGPDFPNQAFRFGASAYGLQFHPEVSPAVITRWMTDSPASLEAPGAHPRHRQLADAKRHDQAMALWFDRFLARWLSL